MNLRRYFWMIIVCFAFAKASSQESRPSEAWSGHAHAEDQELKLHSWDASYFYGTILEHNKDIAHLITGHPEGFILSYNRKTYGFNAWERRFNYPDWGFSVVYQNLKNEALGENLGVYGHYGFYFLNRKLQFRIGQGLAIASDPFDLQDNFRNNAYGTRILSSTFAMINYDQPNIYQGIGIKAGISLIHYSNANLKAPNSSTNSFTFNIGLSYFPDADRQPDYIPDEKTPYSEPIKYNLVLRSGLNESDYIGLGQAPFLVVSTFIDKRINRKSTLQLGADFFFSAFLKDLIEYQGLAFPNFGANGDEDWKRIGVFAGHELRFNRLALVTQLGYYVYYPYDFEGRTYFRAGLKRYFGDRLFGAVTLKSHGAKAEAVELGIGFRL
ncbi:acyloxyacyl hydrolase [Flavobacteriaceae bacterium YJPT1-3]|nr:acyloxyacyl hydrolase [Flavobacteriaceae bacterium YJPT1-3]